MTAAADAVLQQLRDKGSEKNVDGMANFGMATDQRLGVPVPEMRKIAKSIGKDHELVLKLWMTGVQEARIVASMIDLPEQVTEAQMETWVVEFNSWDVCTRSASICLINRISLTEKSENGRHAKRSSSSARLMR